MPEKKKRPRLVVPQTSLISVSDALATIRSTANVTASALGCDYGVGEHAAQVLIEHVVEPLQAQETALLAHRSLAPRRVAAPRRKRVKARARR